MAGYIFNLDNLNSLILYIKNGVYSTKLSQPKGNWGRHHEGTFADYSTMKEGDNVYFFIDRKIYGIGKLTNIDKDCKFLNFPNATLPHSFKYNDKKDFLLWDEGEFSINQRLISVFQPDPYFFTKGIDMDDVLSSKPIAFKILRAFWKLSFIKFDEDENQAFKDVLLKFNQDAISNPQKNINIFNSEYDIVHKTIKNKLTKNNYNFDISDILNNCANGNYLKHEMALEAGILFQLSNNEPNTIEVFDSWDYLSHQVIASPFKPIDYMDKMDIFGYKYIIGFQPTKSKFLIAEIKKDNAKIEDIEQTMKYVDWINNEYCYGDYSMINAFLIAYDFEDEIIEYKKDVAIRKYTIGMKPAKSLEWKNLKFVKYSFDQSSKKINLIISHFGDS